MTEEEYLQNYNSDEFEKPSLTVDLIPFKIDLEREKLNVLLYKRNQFPEHNKYSLLGGFVQNNETIEERVQAVLTKYTGMSNIYFEQLQSVSEVDRDKRMRIVSEPFTALLKTNEDIVMDNGIELFEIHYEVREEEGSKYVYLNLISTTDGKTLSNKMEIIFEKVGKIKKAKLVILENSLAFDHIKIIFMSLTKLRQKLDSGYNPLLVNMLDEEFTFGDLKKSMEIILDKELNYKTLQARLKNFLIKTDKTVKLGAYRPTNLFRFKEEVMEDYDNMIFY